MHRLKFAPLFCIIFLPGVTLSQGTHLDVQAALDWQLPQNKCEFKLKRSNVTSGVERKYKKAVKKYKKCIAAYLTGLALEQKKMVAVAQHGLTREQAELIMGNMKVIQSVLQSAGAPPAAPSDEVSLDTTEFQQTRHH